jgi:hypothetical protein
VDGKIVFTIDSKETGWEDGNGIHLDQEWDQWEVLDTTSVNPQVL